MTTTYRQDIPEINELGKKYGCQLRDNPSYAIFGTLYIKSLKKTISGALAFASNQFFAHLLTREFKKLGASVTLMKTEYCTDNSQIKNTISLEKYKLELLEKVSNDKY
jgi:hypothetical protein